MNATRSFAAAMQAFRLAEVVQQRRVAGPERGGLDAGPGDRLGGHKIMEGAGDLQSGNVDQIHSR
ncbi:MAG: hypothetical protein EXR07_19195 [Acetobacteraceae bacterium]|nr:hypothetical protein [Acetobacteraceae bacterium]